MLNLKQFVKTQNEWREFLTRTPEINGDSEVLTLETKDGRVKIAKMLEMNLSPENLHCDGEISATEARKRYRYFTSCVAELLAIDPQLSIYCE
jgi:hypothetical protein